MAAGAADGAGRRRLWAAAVLPIVPPALVRYTNGCCGGSPARIVLGRGVNLGRLAVACVVMDGDSVGPAVELWHDSVATLAVTKWSACNISGAPHISLQAIPATSDAGYDAERE